MMDKLTIIFIALFVTAVVAAPNNLMTKLKSFGNIKRAASLLQPLHSAKEGTLSTDELKMVINFVDSNDDGKLNVEELKDLLKFSIPSEHVDQYAEILMFFDENNDKNLDINELVKVMEIANM